MALRCLIVDDSPGFLRSARMLLEGEGMAVVGVASTGADAVRQAEELQPDVLLVDIDLGPENGIDVVRRLEAELGLPPARLVLISAHSEDDFADLIAASPVAGFVSKAELSASAIRRVTGCGDSDAGAGPRTP